MIVATVAVDFDGPLHSYERGWNGGLIYGTLVPGAADALRELMRQFAVYVFTCRADLDEVAGWLMAQTGIPAVADPGNLRFWHRRDRLLVTGRKLPALAYVDDRAVAFTAWGQALTDVTRIWEAHRLN